jgi:hypothetical protein
MIKINLENINNGNVSKTTIHSLKMGLEEASEGL